MIATNRGKSGLVLATWKQFDNDPTPSMEVKVTKELPKSEASKSDGYTVTKENGSPAVPTRHG